MSVNSINIDALKNVAVKPDTANTVNTVNTVQNNNTTEDRTGSPATAGELRILKDEIQEVNRRLQMNNSYCQFQFVEGTNRIAITLIDSNTNEVIKEIPSKDTIEMIKKLKEMSGFLIDQQS